MLTQIGGPLILALTQAAQLSSLLAQKKLNQRELNLLTCLFDMKSGPKIIYGDRLIANINGVNNLKSLLHALNRRRGFSESDVEESQKIGGLIMPPNYGKSTMLQVDDIDRPENHEGPSVEGPSERIHVQFRLLDIHHTGFYQSPDDETVFYWQWKPEFEGGQVGGGVLEVVGHMTNFFAEMLPRRLVVRKK